MADLGSSRDSGRHSDEEPLAILHPLLPGPRAVKLRSREQLIGRTDLGTARKLVSKQHLRVCHPSDDEATVTESAAGAEIPETLKKDWVSDMLM